MVSVRSQVLGSHTEVCDFINSRRMSQSQILAITHNAGFYTLFYYA